MSVALGVGIYSAVIALGALAGAVVPLRTKEARVVSFLAFAAGVLFGAAFFHMLPEAFHAGGYEAFFWAPGGFVLLFLLERFVLVHVCEEPPDCEDKAHHTIGLTAFLGMSVHTLFDGVALGSAVAEGVGMMAFIAIVAHKVPSSLSLAAILKSEGRSAKSTLLFAGAYGLMVPLGAGLYFALAAAVHLETFAAGALAFSAGTFLYIAVSDLLPHVNRHGKDRRGRHLVGLVAGMVLMLALAFVTGHRHGG